MADDWGAYFGSQAPSPPEDFSAYFQPVEEPKFGSGLQKRMQEYAGLSPQEAASKYRAGWADTLSNIYNTVSDPSKLASAVGSAVSAGANAVAHPVETAKNIGYYYYENPDAAATDLAFAAFPGRQMAAKGMEALTRPASTAMPRASVRSEAELLSTGGNRMKEAKLNPAKVAASDLQAPMQGFRNRLAEDAIELDPQFVSPELMRRVTRLENAYKPTPPGAMFNITGVEPAAKPPVTLTELHGHRKSLDRFINSTGKTEGKLNEQGVIALNLRDAVNEMIDAHPESTQFKIGTGEYHRGKMSETLSELRTRAEGRAQWRNGDEAGALANEIQMFLKNKKNRYALTPEVRQQLNALSRDNKGRLLGAFGSKTVSGIAAGRLVESALGVPGALWGPGLIARDARNKRILDTFNRIHESLRAGGPVR